MIWATVCSWFCFCWLYRASSSLATKNIINLILGIDHLVMSICRVISCVVGRGCLVWPVHSLDKSLLAFFLLHFVLQGQTCLLLHVSLNFLLLHSSPLWWKDIFFWCSVQFSSVQSLSRVWLFATPWIAARKASLSITNSWNSLRLTSIKSVIPSSHLILCRPLLLLPPTPPSIRVFSNESTFHMRWPKYWSFSFSITPSKEIPGLISFRMDWLDLLAVQGTLKSLLQHHSSKAGGLVFPFLSEFSTVYCDPHSQRLWHSQESR